MLKEENIQTLASFGITLSQATVYLALLKMEQPTAPALSKVVNIARQDVYRILSELQELGLVERVVTTPTKFRPTQIRHALEILMQRKYAENAALKTKANALLDSSKNWINYNATQKDELAFEVRNVSANDPRVKAGINSSKTIIRLLQNKFNSPRMFSFLESFRQAFTRGVKLQILTENSEKDHMPKFMNSIGQNPLFEIRYRPTMCSASMLIFDTKEVSIWDEAPLGTTDKSRTIKSLWTNQKALLELAIGHFEVTWNVVQPI